MDEYDGTARGLLGGPFFGHCFSETAAFLADRRQNDNDADKFTLVHGVVQGREGALTSDRSFDYVHAWLEFGDAKHVLCLNVAGGMRTCVGRDEYYRAGQITKTHRYSATEAMRKIMQHGTMGPWEKELIEIQDKAMARVLGRNRRG